VNGWKLRGEIINLVATYSFAEARAIADKLRALAAFQESTRLLDKHGVVRQLAPEIRALVGRDFSLAWVAETLTGLGLEMPDTTLQEWVYDARLPV
jgi:hypothetical protein